MEPTNILPIAAALSGVTVECAWAHVHLGPRGPGRLAAALLAGRAPPRRRAARAVARVLCLPRADFSDELRT
jgi:hypothetical protein